MIFSNNSSHKKIKINIKNKIKPIKLALSSGLISLTLLSGSTKLNEKEDSKLKDTKPTTSSFDDLEENQEFKGTVTLQDGTEINTCELSETNLENITSINIEANIHNTYESIYEMPNLATITITQNDVKYVPINIDGTKIKNPITININHSQDTLGIVNLFKDNYEFLKDIKEITNLIIDQQGNYYYDMDFLDNLKITNALSLPLSNISNFSYRDFSNVKKLELTGKSYDIAMYVSTQDIKDWTSQGKQIYMINPDEYIEVARKIDEIYNTLEIQETEQDQDKLDKIITYVLSTYHFDVDYFKMINNEKEINPTYINEFTKNGDLDGCFNQETQTSENFSAITYTLGKRAGLNINRIKSDVTTWNTIILGTLYWYLDTYSLQTMNAKHNDEEQYTTSTEIFSNNIDDLKPALQWYLANPTKVNELYYSKSHDITKYGSSNNLPFVETLRQINVANAKHNNVMNYVYISILALGTAVETILIEDLYHGRLKLNKKQREQILQDILKKEIISNKLEVKGTLCTRITYFNTEYFKKKYPTKLKRISNIPKEFKFNKSCSGFYTPKLNGESYIIVFTDEIYQSFMTERDFINLIHAIFHELSHTYDIEGVREWPFELNIFLYRKYFKGYDDYAFEIDYWLEKLKEFKYKYNNDKEYYDSSIQEIRAEMYGWNQTKKWIEQNHINLNDDTIKYLDEQIEKIEKRYDDYDIVNRLNIVLNCKDYIKHFYTDYIAVGRLIKIFFNEEYELKNINDIFCENNVEALASFNLYHNFNFIEAMLRTEKINNEVKKAIESKTITEETLSVITNLIGNESFNKLFENINLNEKSKSK